MFNMNAIDLIIEELMTTKRKQIYGSTGTRNGDCGCAYSVAADAYEKATGKNDAWDSTEIEDSLNYHIIDYWLCPQNESNETFWDEPFWAFVHVDNKNMGLIRANDHYHMTFEQIAEGIKKAKELNFAVPGTID